MALLAVLRTDVHVPEPITALWKEGLTDRMEVGPLDREHVEELLCAALGRPLSTSTGHFVHRVTKGNPLFVREVVMAGLASGSLADDGCLWNWNGPVQVSVLPLTVPPVETSPL